MNNNHHLRTALGELALDLRWSWNHASDEIWSAVDSDLWDLTHNPWVILQTVSDRSLNSLSEDAKFTSRVEELLQEAEQFRNADAWFQKMYPFSTLNSIAYFSMEFMLSEALPIYSGGLGNVAGDQLKAASDLGIPVVGVGLLYQQGYFRQEIDSAGAQLALYPFNDPGQLPITPVRGEDGEWLRLKLGLPGFDPWIRVWEVLVGRTLLYLLDTNDPANLPHYRGVTSELYGGGDELRLRQELVLGIGGWKLLRALREEPQVCHLNEGHAAFAILERARTYMLDHQQPFDVALNVTRAGNLFTTHTPVAAGFDRFPGELIQQYLGSYAETELNISSKDFLALGRENPEDPNEPFNLAYLAMHGSGSTNGVSRLHGQVSRSIFRPLFSGWPEAEVPISHVTNGVHAPSWDSIWSDRVWTAASGKDRWRGEMEELEQRICNTPVNDIWEMRASQRKCLVDCVRQHLTHQRTVQGASQQDIELIQNLFDPDVLTLGFARRFATYKRPNLLLNDRDRLLRILADSERPVQLVVAGKAHPADEPGQALIREWVEFVRRPDVRAHVAFLSDYDMLLAEILVQGVDVWINTPLRPWEACGTSGMKVLVNGGLNLSELDGWWAEAYSPDLGWALGDGEEHGVDPLWDHAEADTLYSLLENEIVPEFYDRDQDGIPAKWVNRIQQSMARLTPEYSSNRTVRQYTEDYYLPAAAKYTKRHAKNARIGVALRDWKQHLTQHWERLHFGRLTGEREGEQWGFELQVFLDDLDPDAVRVELYADARDERPQVREEMRRRKPLAGAQNAFSYFASVRADRPANHFTPRIIPSNPEASVPLEANMILWQK